MSSGEASFTGRLSGPQDLHGTRQRVASWLHRRGRSSDTVMAAQLIVSELAINGFEHGAAAELTVVADDLGHGVSICVAHDIGDRSPSFDIDPEMPGPDSERSRGLAIVQVLASSVTSERRGGMLQVTATVAY